MWPWYNPYAFGYAGYYGWSRPYYYSYYGFGPVAFWP
jgi:hypothetical protein